MSDGALVIPLSTDEDNHPIPILMLRKQDGKTGPYCLINAVRIESILRKAADSGIGPGRWMPTADVIESALRLQLTGLPDAVHRTYKHREHHHL